MLKKKLKPLPPFPSEDDEDFFMNIPDAVEEEEEEVEEEEVDDEETDFDEPDPPKKEKPKKPVQRYSIEVVCENCNRQNKLKIPLGVTLKRYIKKIEPACDNCRCLIINLGDR